jgi:hypothetical protein
MTENQLQLGEERKQGKFVHFVKYKPLEHPTDIWSVINEAGEFVGLLKWCRGSQQFAFSPALGTTFDEKGLRDIADFARAEQRTKLAALGLGGKNSRCNESFEV